jgi:hypothetical protein
MSGIICIVIIKYNRAAPLQPSGPGKSYSIFEKEKIFCLTNVPQIFLANPLTAFFFRNISDRLKSSVDLITVINKPDYFISLFKIDLIFGDVLA